MAEQEAVSVTLIDRTHKRKLDDMEPHMPDVPDFAAPDSNFEVEDEEEKGEEENGGDEVSESGKRPRLDEAPDGLGNGNGHNLEDDNEHVEENAETTANNQIDNYKQANEASPEGVDASQLVSESEQKPDAAPANSEGKDVQDDNSESKDAEIPSPNKEQSENVEKPSGDEFQKPTTVAGDKENAASDQHHSDSGGRTLTRRIEIPNNKVGVLIGKYGDTIKYLQINSGTKIQITRDADADPRAPTRSVELVGTVESLNKAEKLIKDVIAEADAGGSPALIARGFTASVSSVSAEIEMHVPSDKVGIIIGRGGETIRSLQTRSGARIQLIPQSSSGDQSREKKLKVTGDKKQVEMAIELIKEVMNQLPGRPVQFSGNNYNPQQGYRPHGPPGAPSQWGPWTQSMPPYDIHQRGPYPSPSGGFGGPGSWDNRPLAHGPPLRHGGGPQPTHVRGQGHLQASYNYGDPKYGNHGQVHQSYAMQPQQSAYAPPQPQYNRPPQSYGGPPRHGYSGPTLTANQGPTDGSSSYQAPPVSNPPQPYGQPQAAYGSAPMVNTNAYGQTQVGPYGQQPGGYAQAAGPTSGYSQYPSATGAPTATTYGYPGQVDPSQAAYGTAGQVYAGGPTVVAQQGYTQQDYSKTTVPQQMYGGPPH